MCGANDAGRQLIAIEFLRFAPRDLRRFLSERKHIGLSAKRKDQIVMQMKRLAFARGNSVHIHSCQTHGPSAWKPHRRLFNRFAARSVT